MPVWAAVGLLTYDGFLVLTETKRSKSGIVKDSSLALMHQPAKAEYVPFWHAADVGELLRAALCESRTLVLLQPREYFYKQSPFIRALDYLRSTLARRACNKNYIRYLRREAKGQT